MKMNELNSKIIYNTWATFIYFLSQWVLTIIITRISGYEVFGWYTFAVSFTNVFGYISRFGMHSFQVADVKREFDENQYYSSRIISSLFSILFFLIVIAYEKYEHDITICCFMMMIYKTLESFNDVFMGEMQRRDIYKKIAISYSIKSFITLAVFTILLLLKFPVYFCILGMSVSFLFIMILYDCRELAVFETFRIKTDGIGVLFIKCLPLALSMILDSLILFIPKHSIETVIGSEQLGYYGTVTIVIVVLSTLGSSIWSSLIAFYSRSFIDNDRKTVIGLTLKIYLFFLIISVFLFSIGRMIAPFFYSLLFGNKITDYMFLLPSVIANSLLLLFNSFYSCIFVPLKKNGFLLITNFLCLFVLLISCNQMTIDYGMLGASYSLGLALLFRFVILLISSALLILKLP